jgi:hypothetical protein
MQPDASNIVDGPGLDEDWAKNNWLGKSLTDAFQMFSSSMNHCYTEDFMYLSDLAVRYYLPAAVEYAASERSVGDYLFIGGMATSLALRIEQGTLQPETIALAREYATAVLANLTKYNLDRTSSSDLWFINAIEYIARNEYGPRDRSDPVQGEEAARRAAADAVAPDDEVTVDDQGDRWVFEFVPQRETLGGGARVSIAKDDFRVLGVVRGQ